MRMDMPWLLPAVLLLALAGPATAANCALRNPDRQIYDELFPDATHYRSVVSRVDAARKTAIESQLGSELEKTDLGKHVLYVVLKDGVPIGFVHARTETAQRRSVEFVWALDLDLSVKDFRVQRSREDYSDIIESDGFRNKMVGRDLVALRDLLTVGNDDVNLSALGVPEHARGITHSVVLCGVKTLMITQLAFEDSVGPARLEGSVYRSFPGTKRITKLSSPYPDETAVAKLIGSAPDQYDRASFIVLRAFGPDDRLEGVLVFAIWSAHPGAPETWWTVTPEGKIQNIVIVGDVDEAMRMQFSALQGRGLADLAARADESDTATRCAAEVLAVLAVHGIGGRAAAE